MTETGKHATETPATTSQLVPRLHLFVIYKLFGCVCGLEKSTAQLPTHSYYWAQVVWAVMVATMADCKKDCHDAAWLIYTWAIKTFFGDSLLIKKGNPLLF